MAAISADVGQSGPTVGGEQAVAVTKWQIKWGYTKTADATSCTLSAPTVDLAITFLYPHLTSPASPAAGEWDLYMTETVVPHEEHHKQIAVNGATELLAGISAVGSRSTCTQLDAAVDAVGKKITDQTKQKQDAYDKAEAHV